METFLPIYLNEKMGYTAFEIGLLFTTQILAATFAKPVMGRFSDRYGRLPVITFGLVLGGVSTSVILLSSNYVACIFLLAIFGLGLAAVTASTGALVADLSRARSRGSSMGVLSSIMDVGQSSGPMITGLLIGAYSYQIAFGIVGIAFVVASFIYGFSMRRITA
jgi:DHA1 family multidrug resistance protein-like MFS transporter